MTRLVPLLIAVLGLLAQASASPAPRVFQCEGEDLAAAKDKAQAGDKKLVAFVKDLRNDAEKALSAGPFSVVEKSMTPPGGDKHDYMSLSPYWWPDPNKP